MKRNIVFIVILFVALVIGSCGHSSNSGSCNCCNCEERGITARVLEQLSELSNHAYLDWNKQQVDIDMMGWQHPSMVSGFPMEEAQRMYVDCQNLKAWVHHASVPVRSINGAKVKASFDNLESGFDTLYVRFVSQDYYLREREEVFNDVIPALLDSLVAALFE